MSNWAPSNNARGDWERKQEQQAKRESERKKEEAKRESERQKEEARKESQRKKEEERRARKEHADKIMAELMRKAEKEWMEQRLRNQERRKCLYWP